VSQVSQRAQELQPRLKRQETVHVLREAFDLLDCDKDNFITAHDVRVMLNMRRPDTQILTEDVSEVLNKLFPGKMIATQNADAVRIDFEDFASLMIHYSDSDHVDASQAFLDTVWTDSNHKSWLARSANNVIRHSLAFSQDDLEAIQDEMESTRTGRQRKGSELVRRVSEGVLQTKARVKNNARSARMSMVRNSNSTMVQVIMIALVLLDAFCVVGELLILLTKAHIPEACAHLAKSLTCEENLAALCSRMHEDEVVQHNVEGALKRMSIAILCIFMIQIFSVMFGVGVLRFVKNPFFLADFAVVSVAIVLETALTVRGAGLVVIILIWRIIRVVHALSTTIELHKNTVVSTRMKEQVVKEHLARGVIEAMAVHQHDREVVVEMIRKRIRHRRELGDPQSMSRDQVEASLRTELQHTIQMEDKYIRLLQTIKDLKKELDTLVAESQAKRLQMTKHHIVDQHINVEVTSCGTSRSRRMSTT
jgi:hypothetical protein